MVTLTQLQDLAASGRLFSTEFHYTGRHACTRTVGPRGGETIKVTRVRVSGALKTWKTRPTEFRLPVKYSLYESSAIEHTNVADWHMANDCPLTEQSVGITEDTTPGQTAV